MAKEQTSAKELKQQAKEERKLQKQQRKADRRAEKQSHRIDVAYQSQLETEKVAAILEEIAAGLKSGSVTVEHGDQNVSITPSDVVNVRVRARQSEKNERLSIRVRWPRGTSSEGASDIQISS
ncbi:MAG: amphi-Trp domain-containing protein [Planctomycetota bacterium]|nr:amphi-Trp domain-containing protein [Planctomycetota bacterium]MEE2989417.1 amphi-Trp domain-containing protein [Planctomycetota bacterium]